MYPIVHVAYAWLLSKPQVTTVIVGASSPDQLAENLAAATFALTDEELADLDSIGAVAPIYPDPRWMHRDRSRRRLQAARPIDPRRLAPVSDAAALRAGRRGDPAARAEQPHPVCSSASARRLNLA